MYLNHGCKSEDRRIPSFGELLKACSIPPGPSLQPSGITSFKVSKDVDRFVQFYPSPPQTALSLQFVPRPALTLQNNFQPLLPPSNWMAASPPVSPQLSYRRKSSDGDGRQLLNLVEMDKALLAKQSPEPITKESIKRLIDYHKNAAKLLLQTQGIIAGKVSKPTKRKSDKKRPSKKLKQSLKNDDHGELSFTVKPVEVATAEPSYPCHNNHFLNKDLCIKNNTKCSQCGSTKTPEWRSGPDGCRSLCNACGLFFTKLTKKMGMTAASEVLADRKRDGNPLDRRISIG